MRSGEYFTVDTNPKFSIDKGESIFAIGSCFARNIEEQLVAYGMDVRSLNIDISDSCYRPDNHRHNAVLNLYSTHSILSTLQSLRSGKFEVIDVNDNLSAIPNASFLDPVAPDEAEIISEQLLNCYRGLYESDVVILTLGQNECWYDHEAKLYWNQMPPNELLAKNPDRFEVNCPDFNENMDVLSEIIGDFREKRVVVTVSPVPLSVTFSGEDALVANMYNKSVLRCCASELAAKMPNVEYFPSFEMVTTSPRAIAFNNDARHVKDEMVAHVISKFVDQFLVS
jgi:hypothetical protein